MAENFKNHLVAFNKKANKLLNLNFSKKLEDLAMVNKSEYDEYELIIKDYDGLKIKTTTNNIQNNQTEFEDKCNNIEVPEVTNSAFGPYKQFKKLNINFNKSLELGPFGEQIDAYILSYRILTQNNDSLSINNLQKVYDLNNLKSRFELENVRDKLNQYLQQIVLIKKNQKSNVHEKFTRKDIVDIYLYGEYGHSNRKKKMLFDSLNFGKHRNWTFLQTTKKFNIFLKEIINLNIKEINSC